MEIDNNTQIGAELIVNPIQTMILEKMTKEIQDGRAVALTLNYQKMPDDITDKHKETVPDGAIVNEYGMGGSMQGAIPYTAVMLKIWLDQNPNAKQMLLGMWVLDEDASNIEALQEVFEVMESERDKG